MLEGIMIREAKITDYLDIQKLSFEDLGYECDAELVKSRLENLDQTNECVFVAEVNGEVVGYVHIIKFNTLYYKSMANIQGMVVAKEHQRKGYGKELMKAAETWARDKNIEMVRLNSGFVRPEAHKFYRSIGYNNEKEQIRFMKEL